MRFAIFSVIEYLKEMYFWSDQWIQALDFEVKQAFKAIIAKIETRMYIYIFMYYLYNNNDDEPMCVMNAFRPISDRRHQLEEIYTTIDETGSRILAQLLHNKWCWWETTLFPELYRDREEFAYKAKRKFKIIRSMNIDKLIQEVKDEFIS